MNNQIVCPHCQVSFELTEVLRRDIENQLKDSLQLKFQAELQKAKDEASQNLRQELELLKESSAAKDQQLETARKQELDLRKKTLQLEEAQRNFELEKQRQIDLERDSIREKATRQVQEEFHLREKEKEKVISDLKLALEEAQRKAQQGSQQLQGEIQELDFKYQLQQAFPDDLIEDVEKGVKGADLRQTVRSARGFACGIILWESKRTKTWSEEWLAKLKEDLRSSQAHIPVIVTTVLPKDFSTELGCRDGVWLTLPRHALPLASALRDKLIEVAKQKYYAQNQGTKAEAVYQYITSHEFNQQVQSLVEIYQDIMTSLAQEKGAFERIWKKRELQAGRLLTSSGRIWGSLQGLAGTALPEISGLQLPEA